MVFPSQSFRRPQAAKEIKISFWDGSAVPKTLPGRKRAQRAHATGRAPLKKAAEQLF
jgi:hypothetical protein